MGPDATVVTTLVCGDNYGAENIEAVTGQILEMVKASEADLFVAGPCFEAGRYGIVAGHLCAAVQEELGIPAVTAMAEENPGVDLYRQDLCIVDSGANAAAMQQVMARMCALAHKLLAGEPVGRPSDDGYFPRGILRDEMVDADQRPAPCRYGPSQRPRRRLRLRIGGDHLRARRSSSPYSRPLRGHHRCGYRRRPRAQGQPRPYPQLRRPHLGLLRYLQGGRPARREDYEVAHRGYDTRYVQQDPDRLVPVDVLREMEEAGIIGKVFDEFLSTSGLANPLANSRRLGREMAQKLKESGVDAVVLTSA